VTNRFMWKDKRGNWHVLYHRMFDPAGALDPNCERASAQRLKSDCDIQIYL
jgi:hypothetical protein